MTRAWQKAWFDIGVRERRSALWRGVEAQHVVATMRLVDNLEEQRVLEELLEASKPPLPPEAPGLHYLIFTPFRYRSPVASRFRRASDPGVWYGAEELKTACVEVAYWRWRFLMDSEALEQQATYTEHTFFEARVRGRCADLTASPWRAAGRLWHSKTDYSICHGFADEARKRDVAWIRYATVRAREGLCGAVLRVDALSLAPAFEQETWVCKTSPRGAFLQRAGREERYEFPATEWA